MSHDIVKQAELQNLRAVLDEFAKLNSRADRALYAAKDAGRNRVCDA